MNFSTWSYKTFLEALTTSAKLIWPNEQVNVSLSKGKCISKKPDIPFKLSYKYLVATGWCSKTNFLCISELLIEGELKKYEGGLVDRIHMLLW